jgi:hypothetical protein
MDITEKIESISRLSDFMLALADEKKQDIEKILLPEYNEINELIKKIKIYNPWFIEHFVRNQIKSLAKVSTKEKINKWIEPYKEKIKTNKAKNIGVIMAGNIPLVGFQDFIAVLISGNNFIGKTSSKDSILPKKIADVLTKINPKFSNQIKFQDNKLSKFDAIIATGSNNTARYFEYYFSKYPNIIRKSRNSLAILDGTETTEELEQLADDILLYFGLGCRNISKIFVPENYNFDNLFKAIYKYKNLINEHKYANNYDYNRAIYLLNNEKFLENNFFIIKQDTALASPIAVLHYETYNKIDEVKSYIKNNNSSIQCIATNMNIKDLKTIKLGQTQLPELDDYEDNINTLNFLLSIKK